MNLTPCENALLRLQSASKTQLQAVHITSPGAI